MLPTSGLWPPLRPNHVTLAGMPQGLRGACTAMTTCSCLVPFASCRRPADPHRTWRAPHVRLQVNVTHHHQVRGAMCTAPHAVGCLARARLPGKQFKYALLTVKRPRTKRQSCSRQVYRFQPTSTTALRPVLLPTHANRTSPPDMHACTTFHAWTSWIPTLHPRVRIPLYGYPSHPQRPGTHGPGWLGGGGRVPHHCVTGQCGISPDPGEHPQVSAPGQVGHPAAVQCMPRMLRGRCIPHRIHYTPGLCMVAAWWPHNAYTYRQLSSCIMGLTQASPSARPKGQSPSVIGLGLDERLCGPMNTARGAPLLTAVYAVPPNHFPQDLCVRH